MSPFNRPLKDIIFMSSPLSIEKRERLSDKFKNSKYVPERVRQAVDPTKEPVKDRHGFYPAIKHWTLEVDNVCYELWPRFENQRIPFTRINIRGLVFEGTDMCEPRVKDATEWRKYRKEHNINVEERIVGQTKMTHKQIEKAYHEIWKDFNKESYEFFTQNCQNFAILLYNCIVADVPEAEKATWERMPQPAGHWLAPIGQYGLGVQAVGYAGYGLAAADATALAANSAATTEGVGLTAVSSQTAAAGSTQATTATAAKGAGVGAGKAGLGAKIAALGPKAGLALKGAGTVAMLHPVTGTLAAGTMLYIAARGERHKRWKRKNSQENDDEEEYEGPEPSMEDMLAAENKFLERAENPNMKLDDELDDDLAAGMEGLELTQVTSEPGPMPEGMSLVDGSGDVQSDNRRAQTVI